MCGRYYTAIDREEMQEIVNAINRTIALREKQENMKLGEVFPTNIAPVYVLNASGRGPAATLMSWGFPGYQKDPAKKPPVLINARSETVTSLPTFRDYVHQRCLVPATSYFEWAGETKPKTKYEFTPLNGELLYMAGIWQTVQGENVFTILTKSPSESVKPIHDRMPVIASTREARLSWLNGEARVEEIAASAVNELVYRLAS